MPETPETPEPVDHPLDAELPIGPGASFTFLYYFITAGVIAWLFAARLFGVGLITPVPSEIGLAGGAIAGLFGLVFNRSQTLEVTFTSQKKFRQQLNDVLAGMGYILADTEGSVARYQKPKASRFFAGDIFVQQRQQSAILVSRASNIRALARRLED